ncbi:MAG: hypothetical protein J6P05_03200 [Lachnospiraceae bacterium]|nr:hypothetical protein [Lachnospiraceae bacterium]
MENQGNQIRYNGFLSSFALKLIASLTMFIDHMGAGIFTRALGLRIIGRLAFPIYCFLLVEGFHHTKDRFKYLQRLIIFAFLSEIPFDLLTRNKILEFEHQNVYFTLSMGLGLLILLSQEMNFILKGLLCFGISILALETHVDYRHFGILLILLFELFRDYRPFAVWTTSRVLFWDSAIEGFGVLAHIPISLYNGKRGGNGMKWFFYFFYPGHLLFLYLIRRFFFT